MTSEDFGVGVAVAVGEAFGDGVGVSVGVAFVSGPVNEFGFSDLDRVFVLFGVALPGDLLRAEPFVFPVVDGMHDHVQFVAPLLDVGCRSRLQPERKYRAVASALRLDVGESPAPQRLSPWHIGGGNFYIETIATPVSLIVVQ